MDLAPGTILRRKNRSETDDQFIAIKTDPAVTVGQFFVYHPKHGGGYVPELPEGEDWEVTGE